MSPALRLAIAVAALLLAGTATAQRPIEGADPKFWEGEADAGLIRHKASGISLPAYIGDFTRSRVAAFGDGNDVVANYTVTRGGRQTLITVFLFKPRKTMIEHSLPGSVMAIGARSPTAFRWSDGPFSIAGAPRLTGYKGTFRTGSGLRTIMDYIYFAELGTWTVKVRATVPAPREVAEEEALDALVRALPWAELTAKFGCKGSACEPAGPMLIHSLFAVSKESRPALNKLASSQPIYSRDRYRLTKVDDSIIPQLSKGFGAIYVKGPVYVVETGSDADRRALLFFDGLPSEEYFDALAKRLKRSEPNKDIVSPLFAAAVLGY